MMIVAKTIQAFPEIRKPRGLHFSGFLRLKRLATACSEAVQQRSQPGGRGHREVLLRARAR